MTEYPPHSEPEMWQKELSAILRQRQAARETHQPQWRRKRAELRRGLSPFTEYYAYPHVLPYLPADTNDTQKTIFIRLFALVAEYDKIPAAEKSKQRGKQYSLGAWAQRVSAVLANSNGQNFAVDPGNMDAVGKRLQFLHALDAEEAITNIGRIMALAADKNNVPALDYFDLFHTMLRWGNGFSAKSQAVRRKVLREYFSVTPDDNTKEVHKTTA